MESFWVAVPSAEEFFDVDPPKLIITADDLRTARIAGKPGSALSAVRNCKADGVGLVLLSFDLLSNESAQITGRGAGY